jgi:hypothetical protein
MQSEVFHEVPKEQEEWLNYPLYEEPAVHHYPKNPFTNERNAAVSHMSQPGTFHVGLKFHGKPQEMLKLVCLALIKIEIEWQYD